MPRGTGVADTGSPSGTVNDSQSLLDVRKVRHGPGASVGGGESPATLRLSCASPMIVCGASSSAPTITAGSLPVPGIDASPSSASHNASFTSVPGSVKNCCALARSIRSCPPGVGTITPTSVRKAAVRGIRSTSTRTKSESSGVGPPNALSARLSSVDFHCSTAPSHVPGSAAFVIAWARLVRSVSAARAPASSGGASGGRYSLTWLSASRTASTIAPVSPSYSDSPAISRSPPTCRKRGFGCRWPGRRPLP